MLPLVTSCQRTGNPLDPSVRGGSSPSLGEVDVKSKQPGDGTSCRRVEAGVCNRTQLGFRLRGHGCPVWCDRANYVGNTRAGS